MLIFIHSNIARFGEWDMTTEIDCVEYGDGTPPFCIDNILDIGIEKRIAHPLYGNETLPSFQNDIALLRMEKEIPFTGMLQLFHNLYYFLLL